MKILKNYKNSVDKTKKLYYINSVIENGKCGGIAQLARAIGSYPAGHKFKSYCRYQIWPHRQAVKTSPFHGEVSGSNPLGVTIKKPERNLRFFFFFPKSGQFEMRDACCFEQDRKADARYSVASLLTNRLGSPDKQK